MYIFRNRSAKFRKLDTLEFPECYRSVPEIRYIPLGEPLSLDLLTDNVLYLDIHNLQNYIKERTKNAQFIVISLRNNMFELADRLVGIYKTHDVTSCISIAL